MVHLFGSCRRYILIVLQAYSLVAFFSPSWPVGIVRRWLALHEKTLLERSLKSFFSLHLYAR